MSGKEDSASLRQPAFPSDVTAFYQIYIPRSPGKAYLEPSKVKDPGARLGKMEASGSFNLCAVSPFLAASAKPLNHFGN